MISPHHAVAKEERDEVIAKDIRNSIAIPSASGIFENIIEGRCDHFYYYKSHDTTHRRKVPVAMTRWRSDSATSKTRVSGQTQTPAEVPMHRPRHSELVN